MGPPSTASSQRLQSARPQCVIIGSLRIACASSLKRLLGGIDAPLCSDRPRCSASRERGCGVELAETIGAAPYLDGHWLPIGAVSPAPK